MDLNLISYLEKYKIGYIAHEHPAVFTVKESKKIKTNYAGFHTKCLFLKDETENFYLICMPGEKRLDTKKLKKHLNVKEIHFASPNELKEQLKVAPGSVSVFSMIYNDKATLLIDKKVWEAKEVGFHPNINTATFELKHENFEKFYNSIKAKKIILDLD